MSDLRDIREWLDSPGGHAYQAVHGSYSAALSALIDMDSRERSDAFGVNQGRARNGLPPLSREAALEAIRDRSGPYVGGTAEDVRAAFRDPMWRVGVSTDDSENGAVRWTDASLARINAVRAARDQEPLEP